MSDQETNFLHQLQDEDSICRSMLKLSTVSDHQSSSAADGSLDPYPTTCVCSAKRQFPLSRSLMVQEPAPKRATLHPPSSPSTATAEAQDQDLFGYKKLQLPPGFISASPPPLRRTLSEPIYSPGTVHSAAPPPQLPELLTSPPPIKTQPRQEVCNRNVSQESYPFPETAPLLYRTVSDPNPAFNRQVVAAARTPPRPPARRNASRSPSFGESPNARRLRRMKEQLREMSQWANQVSNDADDGEETVESSHRCSDEATKLQDESEDLPQEAVFVEKSGDCLVLHFRCPCGNGYQILLSGNNCYYKLT